jgi:hypothetical protein
MKSTENPWVDRFRAVDDLDVIRQRTRVRVEPLRLLHQDPDLVAAKRVDLALSRIFYPTQRSCKIIQYVVQTALAHAQMYHASSHDHLSRAYLEKLDIDPYVPMLLTGLAGTGKTQIHKALTRLLGDDSTIKPDAGHGQMPLIAMRSITAQGKDQLSTLLLPLANPELANRSGGFRVRDLPEACAHWLYLTGVCLVVVDELQFVTQSPKASTLIARVLLGFTYLRLPILMLGNYSLGHRLEARTYDEKQRLLGRPMVLLPDPPDSADWLAILREYQRTLPEVFNFDLVKRAMELWQFSAGVKRELVKLLTLAYEAARENQHQEVSWSDIETAYKSTQYSSARHDIEALGTRRPQFGTTGRSPVPVHTPDRGGYALYASAERRSPHYGRRTMPRGRHDAIRTRCSLEYPGRSEYRPADQHAPPR